MAIRHGSYLGPFFCVHHSPGSAATSYKHAELASYKWS